MHKLHEKVMYNVPNLRIPAAKSHLPQVLAATRRKNFQLVVLVGYLKC